MLTLLLSLYLRCPTYYWCEGDKLCHWDRRGRKVCYVSVECTEQN